MHKACGLLLQEGEALTAEFRLGTYDADALDLDKVHHDAAAAPADAKYVSQARRACGSPCDERLMGEMRCSRRPDPDAAV